MENLFSYFYGVAYQRAITSFNSLAANTLAGSSFLELPAAAQSVLTDLAYNFGTLNALPGPMQQAIANQQWSTLATLISEDVPGQRGINDAAVLSQAIQNGVLPSGGACRS